MMHPACRSDQLIILCALRFCWSGVQRSLPAYERLKLLFVSWGSGTTEGAVGPDLHTMRDRAAPPFDQRDSVMRAGAGVEDIALLAGAGARQELTEHRHSDVDLTHPPAVLGHRLITHDTDSCPPKQPTGGGDRRI